MNYPFKKTNKLLKVTYHENPTFSLLKCYNGVPGAYTNPENVKKNNPVHFFSKPFSASLWKNEPLRFFSLCDIESGFYYNITTQSAAIVFIVFSQTVYQF